MNFFTMNEVEVSHNLYASLVGRSVGLKSQFLIPSSSF